MGTEAQRSSGTERTKIDSLILKVWRRDDPAAVPQTSWHGQITHVPSGERVYSNDPNELLTKVAMQLRRLGVRLAICWRLKFWLYERKQRSQREAS
jgi:hypothetical protein